MAASKVSILALGHAFQDGERGAAGGAPSKNSVWGVAQIGRDLVTFSGRVRGALRFKAESKQELPVLMARFQDKKNGIGCSVAYRDQTKQIDKVDETLVERLASEYKVAKHDGKVTERKMQYELA